MRTSPPLKPNDVHIIINDFETKFIGEAKCYNFSGKQIWKVPALCKGVEGPRWTVRNGDTPPGLYKAGLLVITQDNEPSQVWRSYGKYFIDLIEQYGQEERHGRAGIGWHGGGSAAVDPQADYQQLLPTYGCVRSHNIHLADIVVPQLNKLNSMGASMWITVNQFI